jgi:hypothetical protein
VTSILLVFIVGYLTGMATLVLMIKAVEWFVSWLALQ